MISKTENTAELLAQEDIIMDNLNSVAAFPGHGLTKGETEAIIWVAQGKTGSEIAMILGISIATVKHRLGTARKKLGADNTPHLVSKSFLLGILRDRSSILRDAVINC